MKNLVALFLASVGLACAQSTQVIIQKDNVSQMLSSGGFKVPTGDVIEFLSGSTLTIDSGATFTFPSGSIPWSDITATPTTLSGYGIVNGQPLNSNLTAISGLASAANTYPLFTGSGTASVGTITSFGQSLVASSNAGAAQTTLALVPGANVEAWSSILDQVVAGTYAGSASITTVGTIGSGTWAGTAIANAHLANSSVTIGSTSISLGGTVTSFAGVTLTGPTFTTPALGTPASGTLTNTTGFPAANLSGLGTGVATLLAGTSSGTGGIAGTSSPTFITPTLGAASATTINNVTITAPGTSATLTLANSSSLITSGAFAYTILGTATVTDTWPASNFTSARIDSAQTFTGVQTFSSAPILSSLTTNGMLTTSGGTGTVGVVAVVPTSNSTGFSIAGGTTSKTLTVNNSLTLAGTDATTMTFPGTSATIARTDAAQTFTGVQTISSAPILSALTGYLYGNGASAVSASTTIPSSALSGLGTGVATALGLATNGTGGFPVLTSTGLNSVAIGATTPSTGAFTTLSASGTSALTGNVGIGEASNAAIVLGIGGSTSGNGATGTQFNSNFTTSGNNQGGFGLYVAGGITMAANTGTGYNSIYVATPAIISGTLANGYMLQLAAPAAGMTGGFLNNGSSNLVGTTTIGNASATAIENVNGTNSGTAGGAYLDIQNNGTSVLALGNTSALTGGSYSAVALIQSSNNLVFETNGTTTVLTLTSAGSTFAGQVIYGSASGGVSSTTANAGTNATVAQWINTSGTLDVGVEQGSGGVYFSGDAGYAGIMRSAGQLAIGTASGGSSVLVYTANTLALTLDTSQNATFKGQETVADADLRRTTTTFTNGAASSSPTLGAAGPAGATTPTKWIPINDNGTTRYIPAW